MDWFLGTLTKLRCYRSWTSLEKTNTEGERNVLSSTLRNKIVFLATKRESEKERMKKTVFHPKLVNKKTVPRGRWLFKLSSMAVKAVYIFLLSWFFPYLAGHPKFSTQIVEWQKAKVDWINLKDCILFRFAFKAFIARRYFYLHF